MKKKEQIMDQRFLETMIGWKSIVQLAKALAKRSSVQKTMFAGEVVLVGFGWYLFGVWSTSFEPVEDFGESSGILSHVHDTL